MTNLYVPDTERLIIELMDSSDADLMWELDQDVEVMRYINGGKPTSREDVEKIMLPRMAKYRNPIDGWGLWKVLLKTDKTFLGWILVRPMHFFNDDRQDDNLELGWRFHQAHWGKGYGTEAARAVMQAIHQQRGITHFSAIVDTNNNASVNIIKKLGMTFEKRDVFRDPLIDEVVDYYTIENYSI